MRLTSGPWPPVPTDRPPGSPGKIQAASWKAAFFFDVRPMMEASSRCHARRFRRIWSRMTCGNDLGRILPAYFLNVEKYSLSLTVWIFALPIALLGKSILVARATPVCIALFGVASVMLVLKGFFSSRLGLAPEILLGFACCIWRSRGSAPNRFVLLSLLGAPFSASLAGLQKCRIHIPI